MQNDLKGRLLQRAETLFKTDIRYLLHGSFWLGISQIITTGSTLILAMAFARFVPKEIYGQYKYIISLANIFGIFSLSGLGTALTQSSALGFDGSLKKSFYSSLRWSALMLIVALLTAGYYFTHNQATLASGLVIIALFNPVFISASLWGPFLSGKKKFKAATIYNSADNLITFSALFIAVFLNQNPIVFVAIYFITNTLAALTIYLIVSKKYIENDLVDPQSLGYAKHLSVMNIIGSVADNIDSLLVFHYVGAAQLAIYNFAIAIPDQLKGPLKNLDNMILPKFAERGEKELRDGMRSKVFWLFVFSIAITIGYIIAAPFIYHLFFPKYSDSILYSQIFSLSFLVIPFGPIGLYMSAKKKIKELYIGSTVIPLIQIVIMFSAISLYGLMGLVIARVINRLLSGLITLLLYRV